MRRLYCVVGVLIGVVSAQAQLEPEGSYTVLYFPQLADGGGEDRWQTTLTFIHGAYSPQPAEVRVQFYGNDGGPLALDFGQGPVSSLRFTLPPNGVRRFRSQMASATTVTGWAVAYASLPIQGTVAFRQFLSGRPAVELTAHATLPTPRYLSLANPETGIAVANTSWSAWRTLNVAVRDAGGSLLGTRSLSLPPYGHRAFNLRELFPGLPADFIGTVVLHDPTEVSFVAWTVHAEGGLMSTLPSGRYPWPPPHWERIVAVFTRILDVGRRVVPSAFTQDVSLDISPDPVVNAYAYRSEGRIQINLAMSELYGDAEAELAWVVAHEMGHIIQFRLGRQVWSSNEELDADAWSALLLLVAGYDPYAAAGGLGRLQMTTNRPGLLGEFVRWLTDPHSSFSTRIDKVLDTLQQVCSASSQNQAACAAYRSLFHPHFPTTLPLGVEPRPRLSEAH
jgi:hypothetical protein